jgi:hypothetical protein
MNWDMGERALYRKEVFMVEHGTGSVNPNGYTSGFQNSPASFEHEQCLVRSKLDCGAVSGLMVMIRADYTVMPSVACYF